MWRDAILPVCAVLALTGCSGVVPYSNDGSADAPASRGFLAGLLPKNVSLGSGQMNPGPDRRAQLAGGDVVVSTPAGYCIDRSVLRAGPTDGFALLASCRILSAGALGSAVAPGIMTVSVGPMESGLTLPTPEELGAQVDAQVLRSRLSSTFTLVHLERGGARVLDGGDDRHWRGAMVLNDHLIGLALYAPQDSALAGPAGADLLQDLVAAMQRDSRKAVVTAPSATAAANTTTTEPLRRFWSRLTAP